MLVTLSINCGNAAFGESGEEGFEVARILRALADTVEAEGDLESFSTRLLDFNGNRVGSVEVKGNRR